MLRLLTLCLLYTGSIYAEPLWTEEVQETGLTQETPVTFGAFRRLAKQAAPSVVSIRTELSVPDPQLFFGFHFRQPHLRVGSGSGFLIRSDGYILSNNHVVEGAQLIKVHLQDGRQFDAKLLGRDPATDISLLKIDPEGQELPVAPLGDSEALEIGDWVVAIGNPLGLSHTVTAGIVSAKGRREVQPDGRLRYPDFIQTDASINPGNSGGPLFDIQGRVVGINTAISAQGQGIGFAIPINMAKKILPSLAEEGQYVRSWIGVQIQEVTRELALAFKLKSPRGALVVSVVPKGPAAKAGILEGDIILSFNGRKIQRHDDLPWLASTAGIGKEVEIKLFREEQTRKLKLVLERLPGSGGRGRSRSHQGTQREEVMGLRLAPVDGKLKERLGIRSGALIKGLDPKSPIAVAGIQEGDVVIRCNGQRIKGPKDLKQRLVEAQSGGLVRMLIQRGEGRIFLAFTP